MRPIRDRIIIGENIFLSPLLFSLDYNILKPYDHQRMAFYEKTDTNFENLKKSRYQVDPQKSFGKKISYDNMIHMWDSFVFTKGTIKYSKVRLKLKISCPNLYWGLMITDWKN